MGPGTPIPECAVKIIDAIEKRGISKQ